MEYLTDESKMPFGKYKGKQLADVPDEYLLWIYENNKCTPAIAFYINKNIDAIKSNIKRNELKKKNV